MRRQPAHVLPAHPADPPPGGRDGPAFPLPALLHRLRGEPPRVWSVVMTVFGDAVAPRGGVLGAASLLGIFAGLGVGGGAVRTALSRLSGDGWLRGTRVGRRSFYALTAKGQAAVEAAAPRIYGPPRQDWDGRLRLLLPDGPSGTGGTGEQALRAAGFGAVAPGVWIAPAHAAVPAGTGLLPLAADADLDTARKLAARAWPLGATADAYARFLAAFVPLRDRLAEGWPLDDGDALAARILLVHEYRRAVLRDPGLPAPLLPPGWPGAAAWELCRASYPALLPGSERWLDRHGQGATGPLPPALPELGQRFQPGASITGFP